MSPAPKKGLSIGAAMKQRMGQEQAEQAVEPEKESQKERKISFRQESASPTVVEDADPLESFNTRLPRSLLRRLKVHAAENGVKIQDTLREALEAHLTGKEK